MLARAYSVKIGIIFALRFERRKVDKSKPAWKMKHAKSVLELFEYFCQILSKSITTELYRFKVGAFFWDTVYLPFVFKLWQHKV